MQALELFQDVFLPLQLNDADTSEYQSGESAYRKKDGWIELQRCAALCSRAEFLPGTANQPVMRRLVAGDASETALLKCVATSMPSVEEYRRTQPKVAEIPFSSANKYQVCVKDLE